MKKMLLLVIPIILGTITGCNSEITTPEDAHPHVSSPQQSALKVVDGNLSMSGKTTRAFAADQLIGFKDANSKYGKIGYYEGVRKNIHLAVAIQVDKDPQDPNSQSYIFYLNLHYGNIVKKVGDNYVLDLKSSNMPFLRNTPLDNDPAWYNGFILGWNISDNSVEAFKKAKQEPGTPRIHTYVAALVGGTFFPNSQHNVVGTYLSPTQNIGRFLFRAPNGNHPSDNTHNKGAYPDFGQMYFIKSGFSIGEGLGQAIDLDVPLTTEKWVSVSPSCVSVVTIQGSDQWTLSLSNQHLMLKPFGSLMGLLYDQRANHHNLDKGYQINDIDITISGDDENLLKIPMDVTMWIDENDFQPNPFLCFDQKYLANYPNKPKEFALKSDWGNKPVGNVPGPYTYPDPMGKPVVFWVHGKTGKMTVKLNITPFDPAADGGAYAEWYQVEVAPNIPNPQDHIIQTGGKISYYDDPAHNVKEAYEREVTIEPGQSSSFIINNDKATYLGDGK